jgi:hypothetical protein
MGKLLALLFLVDYLCKSFFEIVALKKQIRLREEIINEDL